ncbi:MAG: transposase [Actinomycetota bacterium]|nr:transposase [Actinomycetota bacterium]
MAEAAAIPVLERFSGVYLYDGTVVAPPGELKEVHPGCGGGHGKEAALKVGARLELLGGGLRVALGAGRSHDRTLALGAARMPEGALRLADPGFFDLALLGSLSARGCHWLTRLMAGTALYDAQGARMDLASLLGDLEDGEVELEVEVGARARLPARLLASRVPEEVANERRRRLRKGAKQRRQPLSEERTALAGWTILVTDTPAGMLTIEEALTVMRARWQIEKLFDLWKRYGHLDKSRSEKPQRILSEVYAKLIGLIVGHWAILAGGWRRAGRSLVKAARTVRRMALSMAGDLGDLRRLVRILESIARCMEAGCRVDKRRKQPGTAQQLLALTKSGEEAAIA